MSADLEVRIRRLAHGKGLSLPAYATPLAAGLDLAAAIPAGSTLMLAPGAREAVPSGFAIELPPGYEAQVRPRSGLALRHGVTCLNAPGTIDADYRGEIMVILINHADAPFPIRRGERIAQLIIAPVSRVSWAEVEEIGETLRGARGFGSSGRS